MIPGHHQLLAELVDCLGVPGTERYDEAVLAARLYLAEAQEREARQPDSEVLRVALKGIANLAHLAWTDPPTVKQAFEMIEAKADAALVALPPSAYGGLIAVVRNATEKGLVIHVATRRTCAEHLDFGDDNRTEPLTASDFSATGSLDVTRLARAFVVVGLDLDGLTPDEGREVVSQLAAVYDRLGSSETYWSTEEPERFR